MKRPSKTSTAPGRPAYDNPVGNKGKLAAGANRGARATTHRVAKKTAPPVSHASDQKLGIKPKNAKPNPV